MRHLPKLYQLKTFQEVIRNGSIRAAARAMNQSQPTVTRTIRELEERLETVLMTRSAKGVKLTEAGKQFAIRMQAILSELERAIDEIQMINQNAQGSLHIGFSSLIELTVFPKVLAEFRRAFPNTLIKLNDGQLSSHIPLIREKHLDFAVGSVTEDFPLTEFIIKPLFKAPFGIVCRKGHPLAQATSWSQLAQARWVIPQTDMGYYHQLKQQLAPIYSSLENAPIFTDSMVCGFNLIVKQDYLCILARAMSEPFLMHNHFAIIPIKEFIPMATYSLIYSNETPLTQPAAQMIKILQWHCQNTNWEEPYP